MTPFALQAVDLTVGYRSRRAQCGVLERVNLSIRAGELVCLLGPNGAGKSTLLRTLARMQPALGGRITLGGEDLGSMSQTEVARRLGVVLTDRVVLDAMPVRRVIEFGRYPHCDWLGRLSVRDRGVVDRVLDAAGVRHLAERDFSRLSDGERQRVMIARALAQEPALLVLDEPTAYLDAASRVELMTLLLDLTRHTRIAALVATHELDLALGTADRIWLILPGGEVVSGSPDEVTGAGSVARAFHGRPLHMAGREKADGRMDSISAMRGSPEA